MYVCMYGVCVQIVGAIRKICFEKPSPEKKLSYF